MAKSRRNRQNRAHTKAQGGGPAGQVPRPLGNDPIARMLGEQQAKERNQALQNFIGQVVSRQVAVAMQAYGQGINHLAAQVQMMMLMQDSMRRLLEDKGHITKEEFEAKAQELQDNARRAHEISHDMEIDRDDRVKMLVEECELELEQAENLVDEVAQSMAGAGLEGLVQKEDTPEGEEAPQEENPDQEQEEESDEPGPEEQAAAAAGGDDKTGSKLHLP